jgi:hypothetical protein
MKAVGEMSGKGSNCNVKRVGNRPKNSGQSGASPCCGSAHRFSLGVDVTTWFPQAAIRLRSPAMYIALVLVIVAAWWQKRKSEQTGNPNI